MATFNDNIKFWFEKKNINHLMNINEKLDKLINIFRSSDCHSDETTNPCELLLKISNFRNKMVDFHNKFNERGF